MSDRAIVDDWWKYTKSNLRDDVRDELADSSRRERSLKLIRDGVLVTGLLNGWKGKYGIEAQEDLSGLLREILRKKRAFKVDVGQGDGYLGKVEMRLALPAVDPKNALHWSVYRADRSWLLGYEFRFVATPKGLADVASGASMPRARKRRPRDLLGPR